MIYALATTCSAQRTRDYLQWVGKTLLFCVLLMAGSSLWGNVQAQPTHGEITTVDGNRLRVELDDSISVEDSTEGRVVQTRTVGGRTVQMTFALVIVDRVERPASGTWVAHCRITRRSENIDVGDKVRFETVERRSHLVVRSDPAGTTVFVDGDTLGTTPIDRPIQAGTYQLRLEREGYATQTRTISVQPGKERVVDVPLPVTKGRLVVNSLPKEAVVMLNNAKLGRTPLTTRVQTGTDTLTVRREGYLPDVRVVDVEKDQETRVNVSLRRPLRIRLAEKQGEAVSNVQLRREKDQLVVNYDLVGGSEEYTVSLLLSTDGGKTYEELPETVKGEVGGGIQPGSDKTLVWVAIEDFPKGFPGEGNRLRVATDPKGGSGIFWVIGSALVAGGGATAAVLFFGGDGGGQGSFPDAPPSPPQ